MPDLERYEWLVLKNGDRAQAKWGTSGKNREKEGFRENYPGHGYTNEVIFTQVRKGQKPELFIVTHKMKHFILP